jgi:hypothetical protein
MYHLNVHAEQVLTATICYVSLCETNDDGVSYTIATAVSSSNLHAQADEDPVWVFCEQVRDALSRALSTGDGGVWWQLRESDGVDGGWGGAGQTRLTERSEDDRD